MSGRKITQKMNHYKILPTLLHSLHRHFTVSAGHWGHHHCSFHTTGHESPSADVRPAAIIIFSPSWISLNRLFRFISSCFSTGSWMLTSSTYFCFIYCFRERPFYFKILKYCYRTQVQLLHFIWQKFHSTINFEVFILSHFKLL